MSTSAFGDGLDLSKMDTITPEELRQFREFYDRVKGGSLPAHEFLLENRPDLLKRHRAIAREMTDLVNEEHPLVHTLAHLHFYAVMGFEFGIWYETRQALAGGATKAEILDTLGVAYLHAGPMGMARVSAALTEYMRSWSDPAPTERFPHHWDAAAQVLRSGLDLSTAEVLPGEMERLAKWYTATLGETPPYAEFLMQHRPRVMKAYRNRLENAIKGTLPPQAVPYFQLHHAVSRGFSEHIREPILLAKALGLKKSEVLDAISWALLYGGPNGIGLVQKVAGDILSSYDDGRGDRS